MYLLKTLNFLLLALTLFSSCNERDLLSYKELEKPNTIKTKDSLNALPTLKSISESSRKPFRLIAGTSLSDYLEKGNLYKLITSNFDGLVLGYEMKHGAIVMDEGTMDFSSSEDLMELAKSNGIEVYGHTLVWHANQNAVYLNGLIAPKINEDTEPTWELVASEDFETDEQSNYEYNDNAEVSYTAEGMGFNGEGRALKITNEEVRENDFDCQFFFNFSPKVEVGEKYRFSMDIKADEAAAVGTQAQIVPFEYKFYDFFGQLQFTNDWAHYTKEITVTEDMEGSGTIAFNLGNTATNYFLDNLQLEKLNESGTVLDPSIIEDGRFDEAETKWIGWGTGSFELSSEDYNESSEGFSLKFSNSSEGNFWDSQLAYEFQEPLTEGDTYVLKLNVKSSKDGHFPVEVQSSSDFSSDAFETLEVTPEWQEKNLKVSITADSRDRLVFSNGDFNGDLFIDNISLRRENPDGGIIEKSPERKTEIVDSVMKNWISEMVSNFPDVYGWDVVNEPMDDGNPFEIKSGVNKELNEDEFYWQDYLGKDYAVKAFKYARENIEDDVSLFINDYNLEYNLEKCKGLISYVEYIEEHGAKVDGIGTQMHIDINSDTGDIKTMFHLLANTGKLIRVSELDIGLGKDVFTGDATDSLYRKQEGMYRFVLQQYSQIIPKEQQFDFTIWSPLDSPKESSWRPDEPIGLWTLNYERKLAYKAVAEALAKSAEN